MAGQRGSVDFVGYATGTAGAAAQPAGFFSLFDGTGIPVGSAGGAAQPGGPSAPMRDFRHWFDPRLARIAARSWKDREAKRAEFADQLHEAVTRLENIGRSVAPLREAVQTTVARYRVRKVVPLRVPVPPELLAPPVADEPDLDYVAMLRSDALLKRLDDLMEWAEEEELLMAFIASERL